ncbi:uncharacterized protein [Setaria viridis]|uniref:uncharacterized protein n=1 Tax=Setaria viridis TaxID=4556 RepID=UPI003B3B7E48
MELSLLGLQSAEKTSLVNAIDLTRMLETAHYCELVVESSEIDDLPLLPPSLLSHSFTERCLLLLSGASSYCREVAFSG